MRRPADIAGIDRDLLQRYPANSLRALGERFGIEDARAGAFAGAEYVKFAVERLTPYTPGFGGIAPDLTKEEMHEFVVGLVLGLDGGRHALDRS